MIKPKINEIKEHLQNYSIVPIYLELFSRIKMPIEILIALKKQKCAGYLLYDTYIKQSFCSTSKSFYWLLLNDISKPFLWRVGFVNKVVLNP